MLWLHPILQAACFLLSLYVLSMGVNRFRFQHLKRKCAFNWKRHVLLGKVVIWTWLAGTGLGLYMAATHWGAVGLTGPHYGAGLVMVPFLAVSLVSGYILQKPSGKRPHLALTHGLVNVVLVILAAYQSWSGWEAIKLFLLG